jgi:hypothetical protein
LDIGGNCTHPFRGIVQDDPRAKKGHLHNGTSLGRLGLCNALQDPPLKGCEQAPIFLVRALHERVKKQERKRLNLEATIDYSVRTHNYSVDSIFKREHHTEKSRPQQYWSPPWTAKSFFSATAPIANRTTKGCFGIDANPQQVSQGKLDQLQQENERLLHKHKQ